VRALMRAGMRLVASSGMFWLITALAGFQDSWTEGVYLLLFLGGLTDVFIAGAFTFAALMGDDSRLAVEFDRDRVQIWWGDDARERRAGYLEARERGTSRKEPAVWPDNGLRWGYPGGLSSWAPPGPLPSAACQEMITGRWPLAGARSDPGPPQKRLLPLSPSLPAQGIEFPERAAYSRYDRFGRPQELFPIHFRAMGPDIVRLGYPITEVHIDPHGGCPACEAWKRGALDG
jgi:hypothetical protein